MKQQTAVEWLTIEAMKFLNQAMAGTLNEDTIEDDVSTIITKAKEMEKKQIIDAYNDGQGNHVKVEFKSAERYWDDLLKSEYEKHQEVKKGCTGPK